MGWIPYLRGSQKGDMICNRAIDQMAEILGKGIANICYVINPEIVVLGGGIMAQEEFLRGKIQNSVKSILYPVLRNVLNSIRKAPK